MPFEIRSQLFKDVCKYAKEKNAEKVAELIDAAKVCIDFRNGLYTPAMWLAEQGERGAVEFLMNEFGASKRGPVFGYALRGDEAEVNKLLKGETEYPPPRAILELEQRPKGIPDDLRALADQAYAQGGHTTMTANSYHALFSRMIGFAQAGNEAEVMRIQDGSSVPPHLRGELYVRMKFGYGQAGNIEMIDDYSSQFYFSSRLYVIFGFIENGSQDYSFTTNVEQDLVRSCIFMSNCLHGRTELVTKIIEEPGFNIRLDDEIYKQAVTYAAKGGHISLVNLLIKNGAMVSEAVKGYELNESWHCSREKNRVRVMTLTDNLELRKLLSKRESSREILANKRAVFLMGKNISYRWTEALSDRETDLNERNHPQYLNLSIFYFEIIPKLLKNVPKEIVAVYLSFIVPFSAEAIGKFLTITSAVNAEALQDKKWKVGLHRYALLKRTFWSGQVTKELSISAAELTSCLPPQYERSILTEKFRELAGVRIDISYADIMEAINNFSIQTICEARRPGSLKSYESFFSSSAVPLPREIKEKEVVDKISRIFDGKVKQALVSNALKLG